MKYRKRPVVIEAIQFTAAMFRGEVALPEGVKTGVFKNDPDERVRFYIDTLEGQMNVSVGDWIITGVKGEKYPCKPDIFEATYEKVEP